jgi:two-component system, chemotaxis family, sensor kinase CheA
MFDEEVPEEILQRFRQLAAERLARAESLWSALLQGTGAEEDAAELLRLVHTLKGDAQVVRLAEVDLVCHKLEDLLTVAKGLAYAVPEDVDLLVTMSFHFIGLLARKRAGASVAGIDLDGFVQEVDQAVRAAHALERRQAPGLDAAAKDAIDDPSLDRGIRLARAATLAFLEHLGARGASRERLQRLWRMLRQEAAQMSSTALEPLVERHAAAARELGEQLGKQVEIGLQIQGLHVTSRVADAIDVGLLHCLRNAVDHGLEPPDERAAAGKPRRGTIRITTELRDHAVEIAVEDDGRGREHATTAPQAFEARPTHDPARRRTAACGAQELAQELLFRPGLSTAAGPGRVSGRGVGLDAVRSMLHRVGGEVSAHARPDGGTRFVMRVPAPLHHVQLHVFEVRPGLRVAIPASWTVTSTRAPVASAVDPLEALGVVERSAGASRHAVTLQWGALHACYAAVSEPRLATGQRICPTAPTDPMEVVTVQGHEVLVLRPDQLTGPARARDSHERGV